MKKFTTILTILLLLNLAGCYYQEQLKPSEFNFNDKEDVQIITEDTTYSLIGKDYYCNNDTVFATIRTKLDRQSTLKTNIAIPVEEIITVEMENTNIVATILAILGTLVAVLGIIFLISGFSGSGFGSFG